MFSIQIVLKNLKKIKLYNTLHSRFSSYDFNDALFEEIENSKQYVC